MNKEQFDKLFMQAKKQFLPQSNEEIYSQLSEYMREPGKLTITDAVVFLRTESIKYTNDLVYALLLALIEDNQLNGAHQD